MRRRTHKYMGTEINYGMWTLLPLQHSQVVADYFLTPQVPQDQNFNRCHLCSTLLFLVLFTLVNLFFDLFHLTIPNSLSLLLYLSTITSFIRPWHHPSQPKL